MALTIDSKVKDLLANDEVRAEVDSMMPGLTGHPQLGLVKGMSLRSVAKLLPEQFTPEVLEKVEAMLVRISGDGAPEEDPAKPAAAAGGGWNFDEVVERENTNSVKYDAAPIINPELPDKYIPMWIADMDFACPQPILDAMKRRLDKRILGYSMPLDPEYYAAVIGWMKRRNGWDVDFSSIVFSSGVIAALNVAVGKLTGEGEGVLLNTPAYHPFDDAIQKYGRTPVYSPLVNIDGHYEFDFADFEKKAKDPKNTLFFLCSPHNPTGRVWTESELRRIAGICFENGVFIVSDEIHSDILRSGQRHIPLASLFPGERTLITCTAPSKTFNLAGNQLSNIIIADPEIAAEWRGNHYCGLPNPLSIDACIAAYNECEDWLEALLVYLDDNFKFMSAYLEEHLPAARFRISQGTYLAWVDLSGCGKTVEMKKELSAAGLFIEYGDEFVSNAEGFVRMNIACPRATLAQALEILCNVMKEPEAGEMPLGERVKAGDRLPDFEYDTPYISGLRLSESLGGRPCALLFLRYYGCTVCRVDLHMLEEEYAKITEAGGQVKVVFQSDAALLKEELGDKVLPFDIICDPEGRLYKRFGIRAAKSKFELGASPAVVKKIMAAGKLGLSHGRYEGDELQLPACIVVAPDLTVKSAYYGKNAADTPDAAEIAAMF
ncbi:MAG TPA: PatB family C-S lyase [Candidatus Acidoferrum sp.]|nr:PatB family C-S lyase [Candidatus Acidoferrum sp.]